MKKILHIIATLNAGGAEALVVQFLPILQLQGYEVALAVFSDELTPLREKLESSSVKIFDILPNVKSKWSLARIPKLRKVMKDYDVIHTHTSPAQYIASIASYGLRKNLITTEHSTNNCRRNKRYLLSIEKLMYGRYNHIVGCSIDASDALRKYLGPKFKNISTIPNGVDLSVYDKSLPLRIAKSNDSTVIIMVGRFIHPKDQATVIRAIKFIKETELIFAGDGPNLTACIKLADELGLSDRCHFLGVRPDIPALLKGADIMVHSSYWEGLPLSIVEGMASGLPVIASDVKGITNIVEDAGMLFECGNEGHLSKCIQDLIADKRLYNSIALKCKERSRMFDINQMCYNYQKLYNLE